LFSALQEAFGTNEVVWKKPFWLFWESVAQLWLLADHFTLLNKEIQVFYSG